MNEKAHNPMISDSYDLMTFIEAMRHRSYSEILSLAEREILAAWRRARQLSGMQKEENNISLSERYENALKDMVALLRSALLYKPAGIDDEAFDQFVRLRQRLAS